MAYQFDCMCVCVCVSGLLHIYAALILARCCLLAWYEYIADGCRLPFGWRVGWLLKKQYFWTSCPFSLFPSPSFSWLVTLASFFPCSHFRPLMLPLTCTATMVCPLPETQVQLSMITRSVYRQILDTHTVNTHRKKHLVLSLPCCCYVTFHLSVERDKRK